MMGYAPICQFYVLCFISITIANCDIKKEALGADNEIRVICSRNDEDAIRGFLSTIFSDTIYTPEPEPLNKLRFGRPETYNDLKRQAYLVVAAIGQDLTNSGVRLMKKLLSEDDFQSMQSNDPVLLSKDLYAKNQLFLVINARDQFQLSATVESKKELIRDQYEEQFINRQSKYLFDSHRREDVEERFTNQYGWTIKVPWGWEVIRNSPDSNFVWLGRELPFQWISIHWQIGNIITDELTIGDYVWNFPKTYYGNIRFHDYKFSMEKMYFDSYKAWMCEGIWEFSDDNTAQGGPFRYYLFYDTNTNRTFHINTILHHPGKDKSIMLRQMDLIAMSFRISS